MPKVIIDGFEVIEVKTMEGQGRAISPDMDNSFVEAGAQQRPIGQARQPVVR
jgi:hypothetical protein